MSGAVPPPPPPLVAGAAYGPPGAGYPPAPLPGGYPPGTYGPPVGPYAPPSRQRTNPAVVVIVSLVVGFFMLAFLSILAVTFLGKAASNKFSTVGPSITDTHN